MSAPKYLTKQEVGRLREKYGWNELEPAPRRNPLRVLLDTILQPMILLLFAAAIIYFAIGEHIDGIIMILSVSVICLIEIIQQAKTDQVLAELNKLSALEVKVIRDGKTEIVDSRDLVPGDLVILDEGTKVPADGELLEANMLEVDESALTGESTPVQKTTTEDKQNHFKHNHCYSGTFVTFGNGLLKITATGKNTEVGAIGESLKKIKPEKTPLEKQANRLVLICGILCLFFCIAVVATTFFQSTTEDIWARLTDSLLAGITIAMAIIPEEIPVVLALFLTLGAGKLARHSTLVRNSKATEALGTITVLCSDKTGTITKNQMSVADTYIADHQFFEVANFSCPATTFDPSEQAIKQYCENKAPTIQQHIKTLREYPFAAKTKISGTAVATLKTPTTTNSVEISIKGAPESVLKHCELTTQAKSEINAQLQKFATKGYRVFAFAKLEVSTNDAPEKLPSNGFYFVGLAALKDPIRPGVPASVKKCQAAGVRVMMITGDAPATARSIADEIGLEPEAEILTGPEIEKLNDRELAEKVKTAGIFARVYPEHKSRIVAALQKNGEVVAMTGDGVNDATALKQANVGIAMGKNGTSVAKEAADLILLDDNFNTIVTAIESGRNIYTNLRRAIIYILIIHIPIALLAFIVPLVGLPAFLFPIHIVLLELLIDPTCSILFERIQHQGLMHKPPRNPNQSIIDRRLAPCIVLQGIFIFLIVFGVYSLSMNIDATTAPATAFTVLILAIMLTAYALRGHRLALSNLIRAAKDPVVWGVNLGIIAILLCLIYVPPINTLTNFAPLSLTDWLVVLGATILTILPLELVKNRLKI